jgi:hypothetical protein
MPVLTPQQVTKAVLREMTDQSKDVKWAVGRMCELWKDAFPIVKYVDDVDFLSSKKKTDGSMKKRPTDDLGLGFDEVWGEDLDDVSSFLGTAVTSKPKPEGPAVQSVEFNAHVTEGLTRAQLEKTGFVQLGGLVLTLLNPMLQSITIKVRKGCHIVCRAQRYEIVENIEIVNWPEYKGHLYTVINCLQY